MQKLIKSPRPSNLCDLRQILKILWKNLKKSLWKFGKIVSKILMIGKDFKENSKNLENKKQRMQRVLKIYKDLFWKPWLRAFLKKILVDLKLYESRIMS